MTTKVRPVLWLAVAVVAAEGVVLLAGAVATVQDLGRGRVDDYVYFTLAGVAALLLLAGAGLLAVRHRAARATVVAGAITVGLMLLFFVGSETTNPVGIRALTVLLIGALQASVVVLAFRAFAER